MANEFTATEQEIIVLKAIWGMIDEMVNYEIFLKSNRVENGELKPKCQTHQRLFNILLVDFLSRPNAESFALPAPPEGALKSEQTFLFYLRRICDDPQLNRTGGEAIRTPLQTFIEWLEEDIVFEKVYLPSIEIEVDLRLKRIIFIKICGNIAKHTFARLSINVRDLRNILQESGVNIDVEHGYLMIPDFHAWFHDDVLNYHISTICELLNNIRWGVFEYLRPEFDRSYTRDDPSSPVYRFIFPPDCNRPIVQSMYWDLMNAVRSEPYMPRFEAPEHLKQRY